MASPSPFLPSPVRYGLSAAFGILAFSLLQKLFGTRNTSSEPVRSPRQQIPSDLSQEELDRLPYPPDVFPGGRDVETPYGSIRVFEWGPEEGRKVLLVHGISTPMMSLGGLAEELVEKGCRVMLFDLFGRGYSDTPVDVPHDLRLYITQILLVISSSPLPWTGGPGFHLVGYSFGGGVGMSFTRYLPHLVQSLTLITPGGLIRPYHVGWQSKVLYSEGFLPEFLLEYLVKRRLETPSPSATKNADVGVIGASAELPKAERRKHAGNSDASGGDGYDDARLLKRHPHISVGSAVSWQISDHVGFIPAFMSSFRHGPIYNQHAVWAIVGSRLSEQKLHPADKAARKQGLLKSKVLMVLGATDPVIVAEEVIEDAKAVLGEGNVEIAVLDAGHEVPITKSAEVAEVIWRFWTCEE